MLQLILALLLGTLTGTLTGLTPSIHTNLIATILISATIINSFPITAIIIFITAMATTHTFVDFIPTIFLGAPDADTALGALPGHKFLLKGNGHNAIKLTLIGSTIATISLIIITPFFFLVLPKIYPILQRMMGFILIWITIFLICEQKKQITKSLIIFSLAGFLGLTTLNSNTPHPFIPLLTGLFGTSMIIHSIKSKTKIPKQKIEKLEIHKTEIIKPTIATILISPFCSLLPGLGASQAAIIGSKITNKLNPEQFLILVGSTNTLVTTTSFITLYLFQKSRTGVASAISQITNLTASNLATILTTILIASVLAIPITLFLSKTIAKNIHKISYEKISIPILIFLIAITFYFSKIQGLLILTTATLLGLTCIEFQTRKSLLMSAILIPTIINYLPF